MNKTTKLEPDIDRTRADHIRIVADTRQNIPPWVLVLAGMTIGAVLFAAGAHLSN
jgi:hypothetical protein